MAGLVQQVLRGRAPGTCAQSHGRALGSKGGGKARSTGCGGRGFCDMPGLGGQRQRPPVGAGRCEPLVTSLWSNPLPFFFFFNIYLLLQVLVEACGISFPDQGSNTELGAQSLSRWATEEAPNLCLLPEAERPSAQKTLWRQ